MTEAAESTSSADDENAAFAAAVREAQAEIQAGVERGGLRDDPFRYPLAALSTALGLFPAFLGRMDAAVERARLPIDAGDLARLERAAVTGADRRAASLARVHSVRMALTAGAILAGMTLLSVVGGYWWGHASAVANIHETEGGLDAAFRDGPDAAAEWINLMRLNDLPRVLAACNGGLGYTDPTGRRACNAPLWLEPERPAPPPKKAAG